MILEMTRTQSQHRWRLFEDTDAWLAHCAVVEAGIDRQHRQTALQREWLDELGWKGSETA